MKQLMVMMFAVSFVLTASAQPKISVRPNLIARPTYVKPRVIVTAPVYPFYGSRYGFGYGYSPFSPFYNPYDPFYRSRFYEATPSRLQLEIDDISNDYSYRISSVRRDKSLSGKERREKIRELKHEKENAIIDAKKDFYNQEKRSS